MDREQQFNEMLCYARSRRKINAPLEYQFLLEASKTDFDFEILKKVFYKNRIKRHNEYLYYFESKCPKCGTIHIEDILPNSTLIKMYINYLRKVLNGKHTTKRQLEKSLSFYCKVCLENERIISIKSVNNFSNVDEFIDRYCSNKFTLRYADKKIFFKLFYSTYFNLSREDRIRIYKYLRAMTYGSTDNTLDNTYLNTSWWNIIKKHIRLKNKYRCEKCAFTSSSKEEHLLDIHHTDYKYKGCELVKLDSLQCLCESCHKKEHEIQQ